MSPSLPQPSSGAVLPKALGFDGWPGLAGKSSIPEEWGCRVCVPPLLNCESLGSRTQSRAAANTHPQAFGAYTVNHSYSVRSAESPPGI